ncbi:unnamed protein product [Merluccius merluccius]
MIFSGVLDVVHPTTITITTTTTISSSSSSSSAEEDDDEDDDASSFHRKLLCTLWCLLVSKNFFVARAACLAADCLPRLCAVAAHYSETDGSQVICSCSGEGGGGEAGKMAIIH